MKQNLIDTARQFRIIGPIEKIEPIGNGLINDTFLITTSSPLSPDYILQRINHNIFTNVDLLQDNIGKISSYIRSELLRNGEEDVDRKTLTIIPSIDGKPYIIKDGEYWRTTLFIKDSTTLEILTPKTAALTGETFGKFHSLLSREDAPILHETIPDFHNIPFRIAQLKDAVNNDSNGRVVSVKNLTSTLLSREEEMTLPFRLHAEGRLPKRITHCDTKLNNILFDKSGKPLCVIDLDTTMPGFVLSDFGDFLRTAANNGAEDDKDLSNVTFNMDIFRAFSKGYLKEAKFLTTLEKELLPFGAKMLTYMQAVRFLTDYLNGDTYYKTNYPQHNLQRTKAQMKLLSDIDMHYEEMMEYIANLDKK